MPTEQVPTQVLPKKPLISFIVTTYNTPVEMLADCLDSITCLSLSKSDREIIIVDDGSDPPAITVLTDIQDDIIYIRQPNKGPSEARNMGIKAATGTYIQFIDGDDMLLRGAYEHCIDIVRYQSPDMVVFNFTNSSVSETPFSFDGPMTGTSYMHNNNLRGSVWTYVFRRNILGDLRFTSGQNYCEDEEFTARLVLRAEKLIATDAHAYYYRQHSESLTGSRAPRKVMTRLTNHFDTICRLHYIGERLPEAAKMAMRRRVAQLSMDYLYNTARLTHSIDKLNEATGKLRELGLFPLPDKHYTAKYSLFRRLVNYKAGRYMLLLMTAK